MRTIQALTAALTICGIGLHALAADANERAVSDALTSKDIHILGKAPAVAVAGYRVGFVVSNNTYARSIGGNAISRTIVNLSGVDTADLQAIADEAYADFMQRLVATGRPIVPLEQITSSSGYAKLTKVETKPDEPYSKKPFADSRLMAVFAPAVLPLWWMHIDAPLGNKGPFDLANWRALNQLSVDTSAVVIAPQIVIDFAALESSGSSSLLGDASTSATASLRLIEQATNARLVQAKIALAGEFGVLMLKKPLQLADSSGRFVSISEWGNQKEVALAKLMVSMNGGLPTTFDPGQSRAGQELAYVTDPAQFRAAVMDGIRQFNAMLAADVAATKR